MSAAIEEIQESGGSSSFVVYMALSVTREFSTLRRRLLAYALARSQEGSIRVNLVDFCREILASSADDPVAKALKEEFLPFFRREIRSFNFNDPQAPLILSNGLYLYPRKNFLLERSCFEAFESALIPRVNRESFDLRPFDRESDLTSDATFITPEVLRAIDIAYRGDLLILTGGPGTGKTTALSAVLRALILGYRERYPFAPLDIVTAAPTGRAGARISDALNRAADFALFPEIPRESVTLHRLLGYQSWSDSYRCDEGEKIEASVVVIDEASMMDLVFFNRLLRALPQKCKLILVGDPNQLPSIEAGAILADLIADGEKPMHRLAPAIVELTECRRSDKRVVMLGSAILARDAAAMFRVLDDGATMRAIPAYAEMVRFFTQEINLSALAPESLFAKAGASFNANEERAIEAYREAYDSLVILTPLNKGYYGIDAINSEFVKRLGAGAAVYHGQPIMITANDDDLGVNNGDRGVVIRASGRFFAVFKGGPGARLKSISLHRLRAWQTAYAFTVHKSQGAEYDRVVVIVPPAAAEARGKLDNKALYTAVTRAKRSVTFWGARDDIEAAIAANISRVSGVRDFILGNYPDVGSDALDPRVEALFLPPPEERAPAPGSQLTLL